MCVLKLRVRITFVRVEIALVRFGIIFVPVEIKNYTLRLGITLKRVEITGACWNHIFENNTLRVEITRIHVKLTLVCV
jgi:hypothetical protein